MKRLSDDDVKLIKDLLAEKDFLKEKLKCLSNREIAKKFEVNRRTIDRIQSGETYNTI
jgi:DNA-binding transcriptional regulator YhcF (GntR family)